MPPTRTTEGLDAARVIRAESPHTGILVLSAHVEVEHATELLASRRAIGYLLKSRVTDVAVSLTRSNASAKAHRWSGPHSFRSWSRLAGATLWRLSAREQEVVMLMAEDRSNAGIARRLWVAEGTVEKYVRSNLRN